MAQTTDKARMELLQLIGDKCLKCGATGKIHFHEKHGVNHPTEDSYYREHIGDFIPLCSDCHMTVHRLRRIRKERQNRKPINVFVMGLFKWFFYKNRDDDTPLKARKWQTYEEMLNDIREIAENPNNPESLQAQDFLTQIGESNGYEI